MTPRPLDPAATAARVAFLERRIAALRDRITDTEADIAWHLEQIAFERAQIAPTPPATRPNMAVKGKAGPTDATKPQRRQRASQAPRGTGDDT